LASPQFILASASPRRSELLTAAGYDFEVHPANIDEDDYPSKILPVDLSLRLAMLKAQAIAEQFPDAVVLAADTVVAFGDRSLGKPADEDEAAKMLQLLSGTTQIVITGLAVAHRAKSFNQFTRVMSAVRMRLLTTDEIHTYVESGDWKGKAGGYGIQDQRAEAFVVRMTGSHTNIVGLPMKKTMELLKAAGVVPARAPAAGFSDG
jgi:septum formation protein